ncbi:HAD-superfamily hydrolase [Coccomyxa subellipsoidea C-169]|uniref:HAD-superfamily hydrolase n=1 Tax=Coccomyxa subellipsoidea (strain C-169) TaxID=574566 RepID=I0YUY8_COCSC|nr:HAD-superfamily hydrolase [Coccomyxa subellipsoidea C-169]EIE22207.1 HAD-superfamily hydrolase [Coccomyxa subellipsoidea C-169]|eukprot:XP_005646751.1 HAD-superfamily hydrolase [Coccomyxa subellipsoidea C-169]
MGSWNRACSSSLGLAECLSLLQRKFLHTPGAASGPPAFVFDIDGVLIRGETVLGSAKKALQRLYTRGGEPCYPICFLTNGGGVTEAEKAQQLSAWLGVNVRNNQVVLSHTPFRSLAKSLGSKPVLVAGVGKVAEVAREYGFKHVLTTRDIALAVPKAVPFWKGSPAVPVYFSNPDLLWAADFPAPRFGQGAFAAALRTLFALQTTGGELEHQYFGKPHRAPYALAEELLLEQAIQLGKLPASTGAEAAKPGRALPFGAIYAVGDNPKADIAGANAQGQPWVSVLVRTGVFSGEDGENDREHPADVVVDDVAGAVEAALHRTRSSEWHSLR